jgi:pimeloyl-ACP methyl ester carboxylesterase
VKFLYIIIILSAISGNLFPQEYNLGHTLLSLTDIERGNRVIPVEVYYPADSSGANVPLSSCGSSKYPVLCFGHGYLMSWDSYAFLRDVLVKNGYIIAFTKTSGELFPSHYDMAKDIVYILKKISEYGNDTGSIFFKRVLHMNCAMGHSMGGGAALLAASYDSTITALAVLSPAETRPSAIKASALIRIPSLIISGENDCITRPEAHQIPIFEELHSTSKILLTIKGASHCQMADKSFPCNLAELTCGQKPTVTREEQQRIIVRYLIPWLNRYLKGDSASAERFGSMIGSDTCVVLKSGSASIF